MALRHTSREAYQRRSRKSKCPGPNGVVWRKIWGRRFKQASRFTDRIYVWLLEPGKLASALIGALPDFLATEEQGCGSEQLSAAPDARFRNQKDSNENGRRTASPPTAT